MAAVARVPGRVQFTGGTEIEVSEPISGARPRRTSDATTSGNEHSGGDRGGGGGSGASESARRASLYHILTPEEIARLVPSKDTASKSGAATSGPVSATRAHERGSHGSERRGSKGDTESSSQPDELARQLHADLRRVERRLQRGASGIAANAQRGTTSAGAFVPGGDPVGPLHERRQASLSGRSGAVASTRARAPRSSALSSKPLQDEKRRLSEAPSAPLRADSGRSAGTSGWGVYGPPRVGSADTSRGTVRRGGGGGGVCSDVIRKKLAFTKEVRHRAEEWVALREADLREEMRENFDSLAAAELDALCARFEQPSMRERLTPLVRRNVQRRINLEVERRRLNEWSLRSVMETVATEYRAELRAECKTRRVMEERAPAKAPAQGDTLVTGTNSHDGAELDADTTGFSGSANGAPGGTYAVHTPERKRRHTSVNLPIGNTGLDDGISSAKGGAPDGRAGKRYSVYAALRRGSVFTSGALPLASAPPPLTEANDEGRQDFLEDGNDASDTRRTSTDGRQDAVAREGHAEEGTPLPEQLAAQRAERRARHTDLVQTSEASAREYVQLAGLARLPPATARAPARAPPPPLQTGVLRRVRVLDLCGCNLKPEHVPVLVEACADMRNLRALSVARNHLLGETVGRLLDGIIGIDKAERPPLVSLDLSGNVLGLHTVHASVALCRLLLPEMGRVGAPPPLAELTHLNLRCTQMGDSQVDPVVDALRSNTTLRSLVLAENGLTDKTAVALARPFTRGLALETLDMSVNDLGPMGAQALGEAAAAEGSRLRALDVSMNVLGNEGCELLCEALAPGCTKGRQSVDAAPEEETLLLERPPLDLPLTTLGISSCHVGDRGARALSALVSMLPSLTALVADNNVWAPQSAARLVSAISRGGTVKQLGIVN